MSLPMLPFKKNAASVWWWMWWTISIVLLAAMTVRSLRLSAVIRHHHARNNRQWSSHIPQATATALFDSQQQQRWFGSTSTLEQRQSPRLHRQPALSTSCSFTSTVLQVSYDVEPYEDDYPAIDFVPEDEYPQQYISEEDMIISQEVIFDEPQKIGNPYHDPEFENPILKDLNDAQTEAVTLPGKSIVRVMAGPGSGKTRVLTSRIAHLLQDEPHNRILALTFTKKAAGEMGERLEKALHLVHKEIAQRSPMARPGTSPTSNSYSVADDPDAHYTDAHNENAAILDAALESYMMEETMVDSANLQEEQITSTVNNQLRRVTLGTFHSVCAKILRWNSDYVSTLPTVQQYTEPGGMPSLDRNFAVADQSEQLRVLKEILADLEIDVKKENIRLWSILGVISNSKEEIANGKNPFRESPGKPLSRMRKIVARVFPLYRERLMASNHLDFDDLIFLTRELLEEHTDVRERMQQRWNHILVDEFQDTSFTQLQIVKLLSTDSVFVVGDADQSIYSWRGAHVGMMADIQDHFPSIDTIYLMENYRSTSNIVKAAQKIISSGNKDSKEAKLRKDMLPKRGKGAPPRIWFCEDYYDGKGKIQSTEANRVISQIKNGIEKGKYTPDHEVAIIYRTNAQSRALEQQCTEHNVKYVIFGSASFYQRTEIKDCLSFIKLLANGRDRGSLLRVFGITKGIGPAAVKQFDIYFDRVTEYYLTNLPQHTLPTELEVLLSISDKSYIDTNAPRADEIIPQRQIKTLLPFSQSMCSIYDLAFRQSLESVLMQVKETMKLREHYDKISKTNDDTVDRMKNIDELLLASRKYGSMGPCLRQTTSQNSQDRDFDLEVLSPIEQFVEDIALVTDMASSQDEDKKQMTVSMMTIHASKGMEFDTVFLVGNEEKTFPTAQAIQDEASPELLEEERRLCYVAMTRAKSELIMTYRESVDSYDGRDYKRVPRARSRFLDILIGKSQGKTGSKVPAMSSNKSKIAGTHGAYSHSPLKASGPSINRKLQRHRTSSSSRSSYDQQRRETSARLDQIPSVKPRPTSSIRQGAKRTAVREKSTLPTHPKQPIAKPGLPKKPRSPSANGGGSRRQSTLAGLQKRSNSNPVPKITTKKAAPPSLEKAKIPPKQKSLDSTWLFPVGTEVSHQRFGRGVVLPPPPASDTTDLPVRVKFSSGEQEVFCARGTDISPAIR